MNLCASSRFPEGSMPLRAPPSLREVCYAELKSCWLQTVFLSWFSKLIWSNLTGLWRREETEAYFFEVGSEEIFQCPEGEQRAQRRSPTRVWHIRPRQRRLCPTGSRGKRIPDCKMAFGFGQRAFRDICVFRWSDTMLLHKLSMSVAWPFPVGAGSLANPRDWISSWLTRTGSCSQIQLD